MRTILTTNEATLIVNKSRFIALTFHIQDVKEVDEILKMVRKDYPKAKHYCYAYVIGREEKGFDDGEPARTAGRPLLDLLKKGDFDQTMVVVVRYFGGTLLGASRLLRTYVSVAHEVLIKATKHEIAYLYAYQLCIDYSEYEYLQSEAKKRSYILEKPLFSDTIDIKLLAREKADDNLKELLHGRGEIIYLGQEKHYIEETSNDPSI